MLKWENLTGQQIDELFDDLIEEIFKDEDAVNMHAKRDYSPIRAPRNLMILIENPKNWFFDNPKELQKYGVTIKKMKTMI